MNGSAAGNNAASRAVANGAAANDRAANDRAANGGAANGGAASESPETSQAAVILRAAGWRVATVDASTPLAAAWQRLALSPGDPAAGRWVADLPPAARTDGSGTTNSRSSTLPGGTPGVSREAGQDA